MGADLLALAERLRPGVECAPWVIEEVKKLESALREAHAKLNASEPVAWTANTGLNTQVIDRYLPSRTPLYAAPSAEVERLRALLREFYDNGYDREACAAELKGKP